MLQPDAATDPGRMRVIEDPTLHEEPFGRRLRAERERRLISLESIAANTNVNVALFRGLERDDVSAWPGGIFRRSFFRAYARAIGVDVEANLREFLERFPDPYLPSSPTSDAAPAGRAHRPAAGGGLRLTLAESPKPFTGGRLLRRPHHRAAAVAMDLAAVLALALLASLALDDFWAPLAVIALVYYGGGIACLGNAPGVYVFAAQAARLSEPPPATALTLVHSRDVLSLGERATPPASDGPREKVADIRLSSSRGR
jgi:hypothetical protein